MRIGLMTITTALERAPALLVFALVAACGGGAAPRTDSGTLRLGYLTNLTQATALVGVRQGYFSHALGAATALKATTFNAGPDEVEALLSNSLDAAYLGPNPAINAYTRSRGAAIRVIAGAAQGGAGLVVRRGIGSAAQLKGRTLATPQLGNTQDVALRYWLKQQGVLGSVRIQPEDNAQTLVAFRAGQIDGAWVPEPWLSRLLLEGGGGLLVDERTLWPGGQFATTLLAVRTDYLREHPQAVKALLEGHASATRFLATQPAAAQASANDALGALTGKKLSSAVVEDAWTRMTFNDDPLPASVQTAAAHAYALGLLASQPDLRGMFDLTLLNQVLAAEHPPA
jgi:NitT/TauT family transport system substrate-binding protein